MTQPNGGLARAATAAFGRGDLRALRDQFFAGIIVWHIAGTGPLAGDYAGVAQVMGLLGKISGLSGGTAQPELHHVLVSPAAQLSITTVHQESPLLPRTGRCLVIRAGALGTGWWRKLNAGRPVHPRPGTVLEGWPA